MKKVLALIAILACVLLGSRTGSASLLDSNCAKTNRDRLVWKIAGGQNAGIYSNPWMVRVMVMGNSTCGDSLITSRFVLTAAHCISNNRMTVRLGEHDTRLTTPNFEFDVDRKLVPQEYLKSSNEQYDIGLLRMAMDVLFSDYIRPICLLFNVEMPIVSRFKVTGWGRLENSESSPILQTATISEIDRSHCARKHKLIVDQSQICAGSNSSDSCEGDSGGPLSAEINYQGEVRPVLYGIVSYGLPSCRGLGIYTNVSHYISWIIDVMTLRSNEIELNSNGSVPITYVCMNGNVC